MGGSDVNKNLCSKFDQLEDKLTIKDPSLSKSFDENKNDCPVSSVSGYHKTESLVKHSTPHAGTQALHSYHQSSYFSWEGGSTLLFWRWHPSLRHIAKNGFKTFIVSDLPTNRNRARKPKLEVRSKISDKIIKSLSRDYLTPVHPNKIFNLIDYFAVPKADDIRLVLNGSSCGLNKAVWSPKFWLPSSSSMTRVLGYNYKSVDLDLGEMFLNFPLDPILRRYSGMDITFARKTISERLPLLKLPPGPKLYVMNTRTWMGLRPSPEWACRFYYLAEEFIRGDEKHTSNPLRWDRVILNLMGNPDYNPTLPNVMKWNNSTQRIAGDIKAYVDDLRAVGWSKEHAWSIAHLIASRLQFLGIQDAPRKRRIDNGPWAGSVFLTSESTIQKTVTNEKWDKARSYIAQLNTTLKNDPNADLSYKSLEKIRGFFCHLAMTYNLIFPYLKGFHLTLCQHLPRRDEEGWKIKDLEWLGFLEEAKQKGEMTEDEISQILESEYDPHNHPASVKAVPRFHSCLNALNIFFDSTKPPIITERTTKLHFLVYGFVDASQSGFGPSLDYSDGLKYRIGTWGKDEETASSNYREFANLVETIELEVKQDRLSQSTVILATDNSTVESCIYKGNSSNEKLFNLIIRFKNCELKSGSRFIVTHVSGERMKSQGTDGISRGHLREGVSLGRAMLSYCPWGQSALDRSPSLREWIKSWTSPDLEVLSPDDWFKRAHDHWGGYYDKRGFYRLHLKTGTYLWHPPPAAADAALEELRKARLKRRNSVHILVIPRLMTPLWLKQLNKEADIIFTIKNQYSFWSHNMYEPLMLAFSFPYARHFPW